MRRSGTWRFRWRRGGHNWSGGFLRAEGVCQVPEVSGGVRLRVTVQPVESAEPGWMTVAGVQLLWNGRDGAERRVQVPAEVLQDPRIRSVR
jgi:hypothetical protein